MRLRSTWQCIEHKRFKRGGTSIESELEGFSPAEEPSPSNAALCGARPISTGARGAAHHFPGGDGGNKRLLARDGRFLDARVPSGDRTLRVFIAIRRRAQVVGRGPQAPEVAAWREVRDNREFCAWPQVGELRKRHAACRRSDHTLKHLRRKPF